jgi:hypothetical protein
LCHCCPLEDWESSLPFVLVFPCDLQEHCLYLVWFKVGSDLSVGLGKIICHRWLFEQLLVPLVRHIARVKLPLDPTMRRSGKPPHHLAWRPPESLSQNGMGQTWPRRKQGQGHTVWRPPRQEAGALIECRQPSSFLSLSIV